MKIPVFWNFRKMSTVNIINFTGTSANLRAENGLLNMAIGYIEKAHEFKGKLIVTDNPKECDTVTVKFSVIFPDDESLRKFKRAAAIPSN